jgi:hypothetical protein
MQYEKKKCENVTKTIFDAQDIITTYEDFKECGTRPHLWLHNVAGKVIKLIASFVF